MIDDQNVNIQSEAAVAADELDRKAHEDALAQGARVCSNYRELGCDCITSLPPSLGGQDLLRHGKPDNWCWACWLQYEMSVVAAQCDWHKKHVCLPSVAGKYSRPACVMTTEETARQMNSLLEQALETADVSELIAALADRFEHGVIIMEQEMNTAKHAEGSRNVRRASWGSDAWALGQLQIMQIKTMEAYRKAEMLSEDVELGGLADTDDTQGDED